MAGMLHGDAPRGERVRWIYIDRAEECMRCKQQLQNCVLQGSQVTMWLNKVGTVIAFNTV